MITSRGVPQPLKNFFWKKFKKGIDKGKEMWYNTKAAVKKGSERSLKIEQQEISTKQKAKCKSRPNELYILNKVKEAKKE